MPKFDRNGDGSVGVSDFIPSFLDRDGDGRISRKDIMHDAKLKVRKVGNAYMRDKVEQMFVDLYLQKLKPNMTACVQRT